MDNGARVFELISCGLVDPARIMESLADDERKRVLAAMGVIEDLLFDIETEERPYLIREHEPGDMGWIVHRHGVLYAQEYGWNHEFEAMVAKICSEFLSNYDRKRERCWIAEIDGHIVGSIALVAGDEAMLARIRVLFVEPRARGLGIGVHLVDKCVRFARQAGYKRITLSTYSALEAAGKIYRKAGFQLILEESRHDFGKKLSGQTWEMEL